jgi:hypothetical protein
LESVWRQLNAKLEESAKAEFEEIIEERDAVRHLNDLDRLVNEAKVRREKGKGKENGDGPGSGNAYVDSSLLGWIVILGDLFVANDFGRVGQAAYPWCRGAL